MICVSKPGERKCADPAMVEELQLSAAKINGVVQKKAADYDHLCVSLSLSTLMSGLFLPRMESEIGIGIADSRNSHK